MNDRDRIHAGQQAKIELTQTEAAFDKLKADTVTAWLACKDPAERERLHAKAAVLEEVRQTLRAAVSQGGAAAKRQARD